MITLDTKNVRLHPDANKAAIKSSLSELGAGRSILLDADDVLIAGNGVFEQAEALGLPVRTIETDGTELIAVKRTDLSTDDEKRIALAIADNRLTDLSEFDDEALNKMLDELSPDMQELAGYAVDPNDLLNEGNTDEDEVPEVTEATCKLGDLWILGNHRLLCGDSTDKEQVEKLMDGEKADMVFTDPPYNIDYQGVSDKREKIKNDKMSDADFVKFLEASLVPNDIMYVCCSWQYAHLFKMAMENIGKKPKAMIVWDKVNPAQHLDLYYKQHEIIFYYGDFGGQKTVRGDVWQLKRQRNTVHPTMKPVELIEIALLDQPDKNLVYDGFLGSGSTIIACEKIKRKCYGVELKPNFCDVIIKRWEDYTGETAVIDG